MHARVPLRGRVLCLLRRLHLSLVGDLADLGLGDIFQIVSMSRRSGTLRLQSLQRTADVVFSSGEVVAVHLLQGTGSVGERLLEVNAISPTRYQALLAAARSKAPGPVLFAEVDMTCEDLAEPLHDYLTELICTLFDWTEGTFSFVLQDEVNPWEGFSVKHVCSVVPEGVSAQFLAVEGARLQSERASNDSLESFLSRDRDLRPRNHEGPRSPTAQRFAAQLSSPQSSSAPSLLPPPLPSPNEAQSRSQSGWIPGPSPIKTEEALAPSHQDDPYSDDGLETLDAADLLEDVSSAPIATHPQISIVRSELRDVALLVISKSRPVAERLRSGLAPSFAVVQVASSRVEGEGWLKATAMIPAPRVIFADLGVGTGADLAPGLELTRYAAESHPTVRVVLYRDVDTDIPPAPEAMYVSEWAVLPAGVVMGDGAAVQAFCNDVIGVFRKALSKEPNRSPFPFSSPDLLPKPPTLQEEVTSGTGRVTPYDGDPESDRLFDLAREIAADMTDLDWGGESRIESDGDPRMDALRSLMVELINPSNRDAIALLVLRFAAQILERGALFLVARRAFVGQGGFSPDLASDEFVKRVRALRVGAGRSSVLDRVATDRRVLQGPLRDTPGNRDLLEGLGGCWHSHPVIAIPMLTGGRVAAILYGDNPTGAPLGPVDALDIFMQQAGQTLDRALLERQLRVRRDY